MATKSKASVPAVQEQVSNKAMVPLSGGGAKKSSIGNINTTRDIIIPRVKLIQKISPEVEAYDVAVAGEFWHTIAEKSLGELIRAVPILTRVSVVLWAPRGDDRLILARSNDTVHWDTGGDEKFEVKPKNAAKQIWETKGSVAESGLLEFGSSIDGDPQSAPAASLTYNVLWHLVDYPELSPVITINARSGVKPAKSLISKIQLRPGECYEQVFAITPFLDGESDQQFYNYQYSADGYIDDKDLFDSLKEMHDNFSKSSNWRSNDEGDEDTGERTSAPKGKVDKSGKY